MEAESEEKIITNHNHHNKSVYPSVPLIPGTGGWASRLIRRTLPAQAVLSLPYASGGEESPGNAEQRTS